MAQASRAGEASIRRGIFLKSIASSESSQRPAILEQFFSGAKFLASTPELKALFSKNTKPPTGGVFTSKAQSTNNPNDEIRAETKAHAIQRIGQDKFNRFKVLQDLLIEKGVVLTEAADVYLVETLMTKKSIFS